MIASLLGVAFEPVVKFLVSLLTVSVSSIFHLGCLQLRLNLVRVVADNAFLVIDDYGREGAVRVPLLDLFGDLFLVGLVQQVDIDPVVGDPEVLPAAAWSCGTTCRCSAQTA